MQNGETRDGQSGDQIGATKNDRGRRRRRTQTSRTRRELGVEREIGAAKGRGVEPGRSRRGHRRVQARKHATPGGPGERALALRKKGRIPEREAVKALAPVLASNRADELHELRTVKPEILGIENVTPTKDVDNKPRAERGAEEIDVT